MKYTFITSVSPQYMFATNVNLNTNKYFRTNADFHLLYRDIDEDYRKRVEDSFEFKVKWVPLDDYSNCFHNAKYKYAQTLADDYNAVCLIDSDLFICWSVLPYFGWASKADTLITATHKWSGGDVNKMLFGQPEKVGDRGLCQLADFPVFINPKFGMSLFQSWYENTQDGRPGSEWQHPLVCFNRAVCKHLVREQIHPLDGDRWVCDMNYWDVDYRRKDDRILNSNNQLIYAIHNKWWKIGRANGEWAHYRGKAVPPPLGKRLDRGQDNFNTIKDAMSRFNDMTAETKRTDFLQDKIDWKKYVAGKD